MAKRGFPPRPRRCDDCGTIYTQKTAQQVRCAECQKKHLAERAKERKDQQLKNRDYQAWVLKHSNTECKRVKKCKYGLLCGGMWICDYMGTVGHKRPCPVKGCTEFRKKGRRSE